MAKKLAAVFLAAVIMFAAAAPVFAEDEADLTALETAAAADDSLPARSAILIEQSTGRVLFEKNADEQLPPASITKVMTLLLVMEALDSGQIALGDMVTCSEHAQSMGGSQIWFKAGEQLSVDDLLKAAAISSANDASVALAEHVAGSEEAFVALMNEKAAQLGMTNTHFVNATGLDADGHLTTARDIAAMSRALLAYPKITEYSGTLTPSCAAEPRSLSTQISWCVFTTAARGLKPGRRTAQAAA